MDQVTKKNKLMNIYQEAKSLGNKFKGQDLCSLKHVLKELSKQKKTPSTSLHTTASKRNQQSQQKQTYQAQSPQTSYRSRLQLTKRNQWTELINQQSQQYIQSDQIAITEYRTNTLMNSILVSDWKQPYSQQEKIKYYKQNFIEHQKIDDFQKWQELLQRRLQKKLS